MRKHISRVAFTFAVVAAGLGIGSVPPAAAAAEPTLDVTASIPGAYPSCASEVSITATWGHLNTRGDRGKVFVQMVIYEGTGSAVVTSDIRTGNAGRGTRTLSAPTGPGANTSYQPLWHGLVLIYPGSDASQPYLKSAIWSIGNAVGCTALT